MTMDVLKTPNLPSTTLKTTPNLPSSSCKRKLHYTHIWDKIDTLCSSSAHIRNSFQLVFGESDLNTSFGSKVSRLMIYDFFFLNYIFDFFFFYFPEAAMIRKLRMLGTVLSPTPPLPRHCSLTNTSPLQARTNFDSDIDSMIEQLERVCRLLKDDDVAQSDITEVLYGMYLVVLSCT